MLTYLKHLLLKRKNHPGKIICWSDDGTPYAIGYCHCEATHHIRSELHETDGDTVTVYRIPEHHTAMVFNHTTNTLAIVPD